MTDQCSPGSPPQIRLFLICSVQLYRDALAALLGREAEINLLGVGGPDLAITAALDTSAAEIVLLDTGVPGALAWAASLITQRPYLRVLGFGVQDVPANVVACAEAGLSGYVPNTASINDLLAAIRRTAHGDTVCSATAADGLFRHLRGAARGTHAGAPRLTQRQAQIARLLGEGMSNKEIARRLTLGPSTVKNHVHDILDRMQVTCRTEAAVRIRQTPST